MDTSVAALCSYRSGSIRLLRFLKAAREAADFADAFLVMAVLVLVDLGAGVFFVAVFVGFVVFGVGAVAGVSAGSIWVVVWDLVRVILKWTMEKCSCGYVRGIWACRFLFLCNRM